MKWLKELPAIVAALAGLGGALGQLLQEKENQNQLLIGLFAALGVGGIYWLSRLWLVPPSTFRRSSALDIGRKYLRGRDADLDNLLNRLKDFPLVWLVGESGAGKSSLLALGLEPRLQEEKSFFPVYLEHWGTDWERGPREGLCRALNETLDDPTRKELGLSGPVAVAQVIPFLGRMRQRKALTPVLIFDQFDDYQTRHRKRFLRGNERKIVTALTLRSENTFWKDVARLFEEGKIRCLFVTRTDMQWGLECVRFGEPEFYVLDRLRKVHAAELLDEITAGDVVDVPERGWEKLKKRLLDDLGTDGWVLPIRMKFAFRGLRELRALTVGHYEREGGLAGLEALDVKAHVVQAARLASWKEDDVRRLLVELIEPESQSKTVPRTNARLLAVLPDSGRDHSQLVQALRTLQDAEILRLRVDLDQEGEAVWLLYHDYLCRGIVELDRRARCWQTELEEAVRAFEGARGVIGRWRALLHAGLQLRFAYAWLSGKLRYGTAGRFAALSMIRLVVNVWSLVLALGFFGWRYLDTQQTARDLFYPFTLEAETSEDEAEALWRLSRESESVRRAFNEVVFFKERNAERFLKKSDHLLQATLGLDEDYHKGLLLEVTEAHCGKVMAYAYLDACLQLFHGLPLAHESTSVSEALTHHIVDLIAQSQDAHRLDDLAMNLVAVGEKLSPDVAANAFDRIVEIMSQIQEIKQLEALAPGIEVIGERLSPDSAARAFNGIVNLMAQPQFYGLLDALAMGLEAVGERLSPDAAANAFDQIVGVITHTPRIISLGALARGLVAVGRKLPTETTANGLKRIGEAMSHTQDREQFEALARSLVSFGEDLTPNVATKAFKKIIEAMEQARNSMEESVLESHLVALCEKLPPEEAAEAFNRIVGRMAKAYSPNRFDRLANGLIILSANLHSEAAADAAAEIVGLMNQTQTFEKLSTLAHSLAAFGEKLPPEAATSAAERIVGVMSQTRGSQQVSVLVSGLGALGSKLPADVAAEVAGQIIDLMTVEYAPQGYLSALADGLVALGDTLPPEAAARATDRIVKEMSPYHSFAWRDLAQSLIALSEKLPSEAAARAIDRIVGAIAESHTIQGSSALESGLALGAELLPDAAAHAAFRIVEEVSQTEDTGKLYSFASGLGALGDNLPSEAAAQASSWILEVMFRTHRSLELSTLTRALGALDEKFPLEAAEKATRRILEVMSQTHDPGQLSNLANALLTFGRKLPASAADNVTERILEVMVKTQDRGKLAALARELAVVAMTTREDTAENSLRVLLGYFRPLEEPPCALAKSLIRNNREHLQSIVELLKWPTCSSEDRRELIQQVAHVTGESFDSEWAFIQWAKAEGYRPELPSRDPEPLESVLAKLTRR